MNRLRVVILGGKRGLIGKALSKVWAEDPDLEIIVHDKEDFDVLDFSRLSTYLIELSPDVVVNTVSFNLVKEAEEMAHHAYRSNEELPKNLVRLLKDKDIYLIHFSTHMVFDGKRHIPYREDDSPNPISIYGASKLKGEQAIVKGNLKHWLIIRTSWPFGPWSANYVEDFIHLIMKNNKICVCHNKIASPTYTLDLAKYSLLLLKKNAQGVFHITNSGQASLCEIVQEIESLLDRTCKIEPLVSKDAPEGFKIPDYGVLDNSKFTEITGQKPRSWIQALRDYLFSFNREKIST